MKHPAHLLPLLQKGYFKALARCITLVENETEGYEQLMQALPGNSSTVVAGITGAPGAGKSTLVNGLVRELLTQGKKIAILAVDPSSPFNFGSLLGDRIRMNEHFNHPSVFIRSLSSRGALGGLTPRIIEVSDLVKAAGFDYLFIETVGVGQSEVDIAGIADTTVVVVVPEGGDEIQTMKAGLMEIADIFVVNKADRDRAGDFARNLEILARNKMTKDWQIPVIKTVAVSGEGIASLTEKIGRHQEISTQNNERRSLLLAEKAFQLIQSRRMKAIHKNDLQQQILDQLNANRFNLYQFVATF